MSKIGRRPINLENVQVEVHGQEVKYTGKNASGIHILPDVLSAELINNGKQLKINCENPTRDNNRLWGLHRSLLANEIKGAGKGFEQGLKITGLGYKGVLTGDKIVFSLGFSHKIDFTLPQGITVDIDKTGQNLIVKGADKQQVGSVASKIRALRPPEPYKGTGIKLADEIIIRKAGKAKSA
jgi:large subunit ribosomal protein L6